VQPKTLYADSAGAKIAYQVVGRGPDLVMVPGMVTHLELLWRVPAYRRGEDGYPRLPDLRAELVAGHKN
jgi:hypothetical protein